MTSPWPLGLIASNQRGPVTVPWTLPHGNEDAAVSIDR